MSTESENQITSEEILRQLKKLRSESLIKDLLLATIPLIVACLSIYFSSESVKKQLQFSNNQLEQTQLIENAKLLESFSERILTGGKDAQIAKIALDSLMLTDKQKVSLTEFFEAAAGGSDSDINPLASSDEPFDIVFQEKLDRLFSPKRAVRSQAYIEVGDYLQSTEPSVLIDQMIFTAETDPFNIKGRSNVLSILSELSKEKLITSSANILSFNKLIMKNGKQSPAYAVGPQTLGWIQILTGKLE